MRVKRTSRGFDRADFRDDYLHECSIQKSSSTEKHAIWLGVNEPNAQAFEPGEGWRDLKLPSNVQVSTRMHLTMRQVKALLPLLARFADTGELRLTTPKEPSAEPVKCVWEEDDCGPWQTGCGHEFELTEGTPVENQMQFCCYCGKPLSELLEKGNDAWRTILAAHEKEKP